MTAQDDVQTEAVQALLKIVQDYFPKDKATFLVFNIVQLLVKKTDTMENAKVAALIMME